MQPGFDIGLANVLLPRNPLYEILNSRQAPPEVWKFTFSEGTCRDSNSLYSLIAHQCDTDCAPIAALAVRCLCGRKVFTAFQIWSSPTIQTCTTAACLCTADIQAALQTCVNCALKGTNSSAITYHRLQCIPLLTMFFYIAYYDACAGYGLKPITIASTYAAKATAAAWNLCLNNLSHPEISSLLLLFDLSFLSLVIS